MLLNIGAAGSRTARTAVVAYDISHPRRARRARAYLQARQVHAQFSVFEIQVTPRGTRALLAELGTTCQFDEDRLSIWWPSRGLRVEAQGGRLHAHGGNGGAASPCARDALTGHFNFIACYDVRDATRLRRLGAAVAAQAAQVQRSVYWLRMPAAEVQRHALNWAALLQPDDLLWLYPLRTAADLWRMGDVEASDSCGLLPVSGHNREPQSHPAAEAAQRKV